MTQDGSSPRMRGKRARPQLVSSGIRIIPAHAGQTGIIGVPNRVPPDHPRACGANDGVWHKPVRQSGSSPRMRGKQTP